MGALHLEIRDETVAVWGGRLDLTVQIAGRGPPLLYLHPASGLAWDPFLERLAGERTVYAPQVPGTTAGRSEAIHEVDDLWDLVLAYEEAIHELSLDRPAVVGQSFGGMLACELAAQAPTLFDRLVLLAPIGLWLDEHPVANWVAAAPEELPALLFHDPESDAARAATALPDDLEAMAAAIAAVEWAVGCTAKFVWPIPDKGLAKRLHRIKIPTLVLWGRQDRLVSCAYATEFGRRIADSHIEMLDECGHVLQLEQPQRTLELVRRFLGPADV